MRVGERIKQILAIVDSLGTATVHDVKSHIPELTTHTVGVYCSRAVGLGLMTADRSGRRVAFHAVNGWKELSKPQPRKRGEKLVTTAIKTQPNSVFALGNI